MPIIQSMNSIGLAVNTFFGCKVMYICSIYPNNNIAGFYLQK